jgi:hypothetical protein
MATHLRKSIACTKAALPLVTAALVAAVSLLPKNGRGEVEITLKNDFIEAMKDRATITASYIVDIAAPRPHPPSQDADIHIAGRSPQIELPAVVEIMNAAGEPAALNLIHTKEGTGETVDVVGAWRIWTEHGGTSPQIQGEPLQPITTTNPPHVFQIHPIVKINDISVARSLKPIAGYRTKDAHDAFQAYENIRCHITGNQATTKIVTNMGGYNYVEFILEPNEAPFRLEDGHAVEAQVYTLGNELLVHNRRMVFVRDTPPEKALLALRRGKTLHVLGVPRIDLKLVSWRTRNTQTRPEVLTWNLPYEIVVVGVYGKKPP